MLAGRMIGQDRRWESALSDLPRTRRHLFLRRYGDEVNRQAVAAPRSALRDCDVRPVHRPDHALATGGKHQFFIPLASSQSRS